MLQIDHDPAVDGCPNPECPFLSDDVQRVMAGLVPALDSVTHQERVATIIDAAEVVRLYTFEVDERERFKVVDEETADWVLKKMAEAQAEIDQIMAMRDARIAEIMDRAAVCMKAPKKKLRFFKLRFEEELKAWLASTQAKTKKLIHGELMFRKLPGRINIKDMDQAMRYAHALHPEWIRESLAEGEVKKALASGTEPAIEEFASIEGAGIVFKMTYGLPGAGKGGEPDASDSGTDA